jgi:hypothetical protein
MLDLSEPRGNPNSGAEEHGQPARPPTLHCTGTAQIVGASDPAVAVPAGVELTVPNERPPQYSRQIYATSAEVYDAFSVTLRDTLNYGPYFQVGG